MSKRASRRRRLRLTTRAYWEVFGGVSWTGFWTRLAARLGLARLAHHFVRHDLWLGIVMADLRHSCGAGPRDCPFVDDDPNGRISAYNEGLRQAFYHIERYLRMTSEEYATALKEVSDSDREEDVYAER